MQPDTDWVGRDLQRLAKESKLLRKPTEAEWQCIWRAATDWADHFGIVATNVNIDEFVRKYAPGVLREPAAPTSNAAPQIAPSSDNPPAAQPNALGAKPPAPSSAPEMRERNRRSPRASERPKPTGKPGS